MSMMCSWSRERRGSRWEKVELEHPGKTTTRSVFWGSGIEIKHSQAVISKFTLVVEI